MEYANNSYKPFGIDFRWINSEEHDGRTDETFYFSTKQELKDFVKTNTGINILIGRAFEMITIDLINN